MFNTTASWLRECDECHETCGAFAAGEMPTRLLRYTKEGLKLVATAGWISKPRYATLSHCWGGLQFLKLLKGNSDDFTQCIAVEQLPRTFRDALEIIRKLDLEYIWIDSLCIVQDDERDWQIESGRMSAVYGGSYLNIAASSARHANEGLFLRSESTVDGFRARITANRQSHVLTGVVQFERFISYHRIVSMSHLATRAWTFQEKILSPRTIHLGHIGALWECASRVATEFLPSGLVHNYRMLEEFNKMGNLTEWWSEAIRLYSEAEITYPRDRLPALSGIARRIHDSSGHDYLAGLWRNAFIEQQLCWFVDRVFRIGGHGTCVQVKRSPRPIYRAPSWSWVSIDSPVTVPARGHARGLYAHVIDAWTMPVVEEDPFGEIRGGAIRLTCSGLLAGRFASHNTEVFDTIWVSEDGLEVPVCRDSLEEFENSDRYSCFLLPLIMPDYEEEFPARGIVLRRTNHVQGEFQRVGAFLAPLHANMKNDDLSRELGRHGRATASAECGEVIENMEHPRESFVITII
jgi:hypothetical protein